MIRMRGGARHAHFYAEALCLAICAALLPLRSVAADPVNLEGTWKIATPQVAFKPEGGAIPFTAAGRKQYQENQRNLRKRNYEAYDRATSRCASPGMVRLMITPDRFRIWQRPGLIEFQFEWNRLARQINMGGLIHQSRISQDDELVGRAIPISSGHWDGDTLVATTQGFDETTLIDNLIPHDYDLKVTERIRLAGEDTLEDRLSIEDPAIFTRSWETVVTYKRQPDAAFPEDVCLDHLTIGQPPAVAPLAQLTHSQE